MYNYFIWDRKSSINNCDADEILKSEPFCKMNKIVFFTHNEKPFVHADTDELRKELQIPSSESDEFVYETYIKILEEKENESQQEQTNLEKMRDKISILEAKNKRLEEGLQAVLSGDMQSLAYILYPEDFADINNTTLEL